MTKHSSFFNYEEFRQPSQVSRTVPHPDALWRSRASSLTGTQPINVLSVRRCEWSNGDGRIPFSDHLADNHLLFDDCGSQPAQARCPHSRRSPDFN